MKWICLIFECRLSQPAEKGITHLYTNGLVQDCSISIANTQEILQSCIKPSIYTVCGSGHKDVAVLLPGFGIIWLENQVTRQPHIRHLTHAQK